MNFLHACLMLAVGAGGGWALASLFVYLVFKPAKPTRVLGFQILGVLPALQQKFATSFASSIANNYLQPQQLLAHFNNQNLLKELTPEIEKHVDVFMEHKMPETFPLLSKLMGEKTLTKFKTAFLNEVELIFPQMINSYSGKLMNSLQPALQIETAIKNISMDLLQVQIKEKAAKYITQLKIWAALGGAVIALVQWVLLKFLL